MHRAGSIDDSTALRAVSEGERLTAPDEHPGMERALGGSQVGACELEDVGDLDRSGCDRRDLDHATCIGVESIDSGHHGVAHRGGQRTVRSEQLGHVERVATGDLTDQRRVGVVVRSQHRHGLDRERLEVAGAEPIRATVRGHRAPAAAGGPARSRRRDRCRAGVIGCHRRGVRGT
jgi:hypothetical protein